MGILVGILLPFVMIPAIVVGGDWVSLKNKEMNWGLTDEETERMHDKFHVFLMLIIFALFLMIPIVYDMITFALFLS